MKTLYFEKVKKFFAEVFTMKKYKAMPKGLAVLSFIGMLPFFVVFLLLAAGLLLTSLVFELLQSPADYLQTLNREEGNNVKHATQAVMYFVAWPLVMGLRFVAAMVNLMMNLFYLLTVTVGWLWSLGGFKFHVTMAEEAYQLENVEVSKKKASAFAVVSLILIIIAIIGFVLSTICQSLITVSIGSESRIVSFAVYLVLAMSDMSTLNASNIDVALNNALPIASTIYSIILIVFFVSAIALIVYETLFVIFGFNNRKKEAK